jgi:hypothetical protein
MMHKPPPYQPKPPQPGAPNQSALRWWQPLTRWWGLCGVIIFIGLCLSLFDNTARWFAGQPSVSAEPQVTEDR